MTREQVATMPAGREMDAAVAQYIFGWRTGDISSRRDRPEPALMGKLDGPKAGPHEWLVCPAYSTDIAAAWPVALWLRERWGQFCLTAGIDWHCYADPADEKGGPRGSGETPELAIVRAALLEVAPRESEP